MSADKWLKTFRSAIAHNANKPEFIKLAEEMEQIENISTFTLFDALAEGLDNKLYENYKNYHAMYENDDEYDKEGDIAKDHLVVIADAAEELHNMIDDDEDLPEWCQAKISRAMEDLDAVRDYMMANKSDIDDKNAKDLDLNNINSESVEEAWRRPRTLGRLIKQKQSSSLRYVPPTDTEKKKDKDREVGKGNKIYGAMKDKLKEKQVEEAASEAQKAQLKLKHAREKESLANKHQREKKALKKEDVNEALYKVDIEGLPKMYIDGGSAGEIKASLRQKLKKPEEMIKSIDRVTSAEAKKAFRAKATGKDDIDETLDNKKSTHDTIDKMRTKLTSKQYKKVTNSDRQESINEVLKVSDGIGAWIKDFQSSDAPQFKGKDQDELKKMAIAAFLEAKRKEKNESSIKIEENGNWLTKGVSKLIHKKAYKHAAATLKKVWDRKKKDKKHGIEYYAFQIAKQYNGVDAKELANMVTENLDENIFPDHED